VCCYTRSKSSGAKFLSMSTVHTASSEHGDSFMTETLILQYYNNWTTHGISLLLSTNSTAPPSSKIEGSIPCSILRGAACGYCNIHMYRWFSTGGLQHNFPMSYLGTNKWLISTTTPLALMRRGWQGPGKLGQTPHWPEKALHPSSIHFRRAMRWR
jgi:hypothetical protein